MAEYICRGAIIKELEEEIEAGNIEFDEDVWINRGLKIALKDVKAAEAADVKPVKRGRWLEHRAVWIDQPRMEGWFVQAKCSECERLAPVLNRFTKSVVYEYCPHCGAKMDLPETRKG